MNFILYECNQCGKRQQEPQEIGKEKQSIHTLCTVCGYCTDFKMVKNYIKQSSKITGDIEIIKQRKPNFNGRLQFGISQNGDYIVRTIFGDKIYNSYTQAENEYNRLMKY